MSFNVGNLINSILSNSIRTLKAGGKLGEESAKVNQQDLIPGDVDVLGITLTSLDKQKTADITSFTKTINIYESIFTPSLVAEFGIQDIVDLKNNFDIRPGDYIQIDLRTPGTEDTIELVFAISSVDETETTAAQKMKTYVITSVSPETLRNSVFTLNFKQKDSASRLVKRVFDDYIKTNKNVYIDPSKLIEDFPPIAATRPFQAVHYLTNYSYSAKYNSSAFVFFENKKGYFYTTVEKLIQEGVKTQSKGNRFTDKEFFFDLAANESKTNLTVRNILAYRKVSTNSFDNMSKVSSIVSTYDFCRGVYNKVTKDISEESFELLDGNQRSSNDPTFDNTYGRETTNVKFIPISTDTMPKEYADYAVKREMFANMMEQDVVQILVYGDTELCVGDVIKCNFPNVSADSKDQTKPEVESGNYLVTALRHMILNTDRPQHLISMELKRNRDS